MKTLIEVISTNPVLIGEVLEYIEIYEELTNPVDFLAPLNGETLTNLEISNYNVDDTLIDISDNVVKSLENGERFREMDIEEQLETVFTNYPELDVNNLFVSKD